MAGGLIQCPACGLLNDVPLRSDLTNLSSDGTYNIELAPEPADQNEPLAQFERAYARSRTDARGEEIDLRPTLEEIRHVGDVHPVELEEAPPSPRPSAPKYDPITGELIRPLAVQTDPELADISSIPMATPAIDYASGALLKRVSPGRILVELLMPTNLAVMFFIILAHVVLEIGYLLVLNQLIFLAPIFVLAAMGILSHYAITIEDTGPDDRDELPRPLRNVSLHDDFWRPMVNISLALLICYMPMILAWRFELPLAAIVLLGLIGCLFFPAVVLTSVTSGSLNNLRPDRVLSVMGACGARSMFAILAFLLALVLYGVGMLAVHVHALILISNSFAAYQIMVGGVIAYLLLLVGIYFMHFFCWYLGLLYRAHHDQFGWVMQRYVRRRRKM